MRKKAAADAGLDVSLVELVEPFGADAGSVGAGAGGGDQAGSEAIRVSRTQALFEEVFSTHLV